MKAWAQPLNPTFSILQFSSGKVQAKQDTLATEEPLQLRIIHGPKRESLDLAVTLRSPGNDLHLTLGYLFSQGILTNLDVIEEIRPGNAVLTIVFVPTYVIPPEKLHSRGVLHSSCGLCNESPLDRLQLDPIWKLPMDATVHAHVLSQLPEKLLQQQNSFLSTGGMHASALFTLTGELLDLGEDVGRHNALDKLIGQLLQQQQIPCKRHILLLSGRISFELCQKALQAQIPIIAAMGAPSTLAVQLAEEAGQTLIGFLRSDRFNVYAGAERIRFAD